MDSLTQLKAAIRTQADALTPDTHPQVCAMRDESYLQLEEKVMKLMFQEETPVSVQTALAQLEEMMGE